MNAPEAATDARGWLEMRLDDFGIPGKFADEITGHHTVVNYNKGSLIVLQGSPTDGMFLGPRRPGQGLLSPARWNPDLGQARWSGGAYRSFEASLILAVGFYNWMSFRPSGTKIDKSRYCAGYAHRRRGAYTPAFANRLALVGV